MIIFIIIILTISIASTRAPLPWMVSVVEVTFYLAQCALRMKLMPMMALVQIEMMIMMVLVMTMIVMVLVMMMMIVCRVLAYSHEGRSRRQW